MARPQEVPNRSANTGTSDSTDRIKLTKRPVEAVKPGPREQILWDSELPGYGLRVSPKGRRSYFIQYRNQAGRTRRLRVGVHGRLTAEDARKLAKKKFAEVEAGGDPSETRHQTRKAPSIGQLAARYMDEHSRPKKKASSVATDEKLLRLVILPALGRRRVVDISSADVARMHHSLKSTPVQANRAVTLLSKMMNLAERWGYRPANSNPCRHVDRFKEKPRKRYLSPVEMARLGEALATAERGRSEHCSAILAIRLLLLTGCRRSEILHLTWEEVDLARGVLNLRDSKTGEKAVPLGAPAIELLSRAAHAEGNPYVCWGEQEGAYFVGIDKAWRRIKAAATLEDLRIHDLRHSFAAVGAGGGLGLPIIGALLGHTQAATTQRYAHLAADPLKVAADRIAGEIAATMSRQAEGGAEVRSYRR